MKLKFKRKRIRTGLGVIAATIVALSIFFPINIAAPTAAGGPASDVSRIGLRGFQPSTFIIGNPVAAQEADYECDGVDDHVQFNQCINALPLIGGQILVLAGISYDFGDGETVTRAIDNVSIIGLGGSVSFTGDGVTALFTAGGDRWLFSNLRTDAGGLDVGSTTDWMKLNVWEGSNYTALQTDEIDIEDHAIRHQDGGGDEISVAGLSGLLADAQTALAHAASHQNGGGDEISLAGLDGEPSTLTTHKDLDTGVHGVGANYIAETSVNGIDWADHSGRHENGGADEISVLGLSGLLADAQTPLSHASTHQNGGADEISLAGLDGEPSTLTTHKGLATGTHGVTGTILGTEDVDDTPVNGATTDPVSSNWAYDHENDVDAHFSNVVTITFIIDGGGSAISTGQWGHLEIPFACTLTAWTLMADQSGSITIDIWCDTYGNFPPTDADTMPGSGKEPSITSAQINQDTSITDWTDYTITAGDILAFNVDSCSTIERVTLSIKAEKS